MLRLTGSLTLFALAHMGRAQWCDMNSKTNVGGYNFPQCELSSHHPNVFQVHLHYPSLVKFVSLSVMNPRVLAPLNFTVTVDGKWCGQIVEYSEIETFQISCTNGGVEGSVVEWKMEHSTPNGFEFCNINVCGEPTHIKPAADSAPRIDVTGQPAKQLSTWNNEVASNAIDGNPHTCASNKPHVSEKPWWSVDLGGMFTVHSIRITNTIQDNFDRLGNVLVLVDGKNCAPIKVKANRQHVWITCTKQLTGQSVLILLDGAPINGTLTLCEVDIYGVSHEVGSQVN
eukprot:Ihof_evm2s512 gene=Ihof_evmTU2s512